MGDTEKVSVAFSHAQLVTVRNEVAKVMFLHVSVILLTSGGEGGRLCYPSMHCRWYPSMPCRGCVLSQHALQVISQHALQQGVPAFEGVCSQRGCLLPGRGACSQGGACSGGDLLRGGGCLLPGGEVCSGGWCGDPPKADDYFLRTVRILLECILVLVEFN